MSGALTPSEQDEWLETDGLGGFASGTTSGMNTRRYHALLVAALAPPAGRHVFVNGAAVWLDTPDGRFDLSGPAGAAPARLPPVGFRAQPWPCFERRLQDIGINEEVIMLHGLPVVLVSWSLDRPLPGHRLSVRPLLSGRDFHALQRENPVGSLEARGHGRQQLFQPYRALPGVLSLASGPFSSAPEWCRGVVYPSERERGFDHVEDLASPGLYVFDLNVPRADWVIALDTPEARAFLGERTAAQAASSVREREGRRRRAFREPIERAADQYVVQRGAGTTMVPSPHLRVALPSRRNTLGRPLSSASFSVHDLRR